MTEINIFYDELHRFVTSGSIELSIFGDKIKKYDRDVWEGQGH